MGTINKVESAPRRLALIEFAPPWAMCARVALPQDFRVQESRYLSPLAQLVSKPCQRREKPGAYALPGMLALPGQVGGLDRPESTGGWSTR